VAWRLKKAVKLGGKPSIEDYVGTLAARVNLPAPVVKSAVELLEKNRRLLLAKTRGFGRRLFGWRLLGGLVS
jgi:hypothetical protein